MTVTCPKCHATFDPESERMFKLLGWLDSIVEPEPSAPVAPADPPAVTFAEPPTTPGGFVHLVLDFSTTPVPTGLTAVYLPAGSVTRDTIDASVLANPDHPIGTVTFDPAAKEVTIQVQSAPAPGAYDVAVFGVYPDPA